MRAITTTRKRSATVKLRKNGKHKVDAKSTMTMPTTLGLQRILRPQAAFRWILPNLAAITPQYIEMILRGALAGNHVQQWELFDLMMDTWPELSACQQELTYGVLRKKLVFEPFHEEDEQPSPEAIERSHLVSSALRNMQPEPSRDDCALEGSIKDILDGWFRGITVSEVIWQTIEDNQLGMITAPKSTFWVHPVCFAFDANGVLGLRDTKPMNNSQWPFPSSTLSAQPQPPSLVAFPDYKFLIAIHKAKSGTALGGPLLRPLAWWWLAANFSSDWLLNLAQIFGLPFRWANYDANAPQKTIDDICTMLQNMGSAAWAAFPTPTTVEFMQPNQQGSDHSPQGELLDRADRYCRNLILGQTMTGSHGTTGKGGGQAFGEVEATVKDDRIDAAGKFACGIINRQLIPAILALNYGDTDEAPTIKFLEDEVADLNEAQRDKVLVDAGLPIGVDYMRKKYDIPEPAEGEETLSKPEPASPFGGQGFGSDPENPEETNAPTEENDVKAGGDKVGHEFHGNQYTSGNSTTANKKWDFTDSKQIGQVTDARPGSWKKTPGDFTAASQAAAHYAKKQNVSMQIVPGNSYGHKIYNIHAIHEDGIGKNALIGDQHNIAIVHPNGKVFQVKAVRKEAIPRDNSFFPSLLQSEEDKRRAALNLQLKQLNEIQDDAVYARELAKLAGEIQAGDKPGHVFHGNQYTEGEMVRVEGSADGKFSGFTTAKIINPHSNAHLVTQSVDEGKRRGIRQYENGHVHLPTATVEYDRSKRGLPPLRFEAYHHQISKLTQ